MKLLRQLEQGLLRVDIPAEHADTVRGEQLAAFRYALPIGLTAMTVNAAILLAYSWLNSPPVWLNIWAAIIMGLLLLRLPTSLKTRARSQQAQPSDKAALNKPFLGAMLFGALWGIAALIIMLAADGATLLIVMTICAGTMCGGAYVFSAMPRAATSFMSTIAIALTGGVLLSDLETGKVALLLLTVLYTIIMVSAAYWNYSHYLRGWLQQIELNAQTEELQHRNDVISLLLNDIEQTTSDCLWETNAEAVLIRMSDGLADQLNLDPQLATTTPFRDVLVQSGADEAEVATVFAVAAEQTFFRNLTLKVTAPDHERWLSFSGKRKPDGGYRGVVSDVTDVYEAEAQIRYLAHFDSLTGLANREQLGTELDKSLSRLKREDKPFGILCVDLDRFKIINDAHGHPVGDAVLKACADRMLACLTSEDVAARVGGDEFIVLHNSCQSAECVQEIAEELIGKLTAPISVAGLTLQISASIGIAYCQDDAGDAATLVRNADLALYRAKKSGRSRACIFDQSMDDEASARRLLEAGLHEAISNGEFQLRFQPIVDSKTREATGFEALLRWDHPTRGLISPDEFINIAEQSGMIAPIGEWVIREALGEAARWPDEQGISINLSPLQIKSPKLLPTVVNALATSGVDPRRLEFEITESVLLDPSEDALKTLRDLHDLGVRISLDDFGTGYSSLSYLSAFPFDKIKIDKSFVQSIDDSEECRAIVRAVAGLAQSLGMRSTAEGVETTDQIDGALAEGCSELQGFYFSHPQTAETLEHAGLLKRTQNDVPQDMAETTSPLDDILFDEEPTKRHSGKPGL